MPFFQLPGGDLIRKPGDQNPWRNAERAKHMSTTDLKAAFRTFWDFTQTKQYPGDTYRRWGNFNFGVAMRAAGISEGRLNIISRIGGYFSGTPRGKGGSEGHWWGLSEPWGDTRAGNRDVRLGIQWFDDNTAAIPASYTFNTAYAPTQTSPPTWKWK
jgi:hypothetical protein